MKVYILVGVWNHEGTQVLGVFRDAESAKYEADRHNSEPGLQGFDWYEIEEYELNE